MKNRSNFLAFQPGRLGALQTKNRLIRSATYEHAATPAGDVTEALLDMYRKLALGGIGVIITGASSVHPKGLAPPKMFRSDNESFLPSLKKIPEAVHGVGNGCKVILQLNHPGRQVRGGEVDPATIPPALLAALKREPAEHEEMPEVEPVAPSPLYDPFYDRTPRGLTLEEVEELIDCFAAAVGRAKEAGFDGVQLHAAHGWLLSSFLSPHTNRRNDQYGGSTENRARIVTEIVRRARKIVGDDFPLLVKMNMTDIVPGGIEPDEAAAMGAIFTRAGICAVETSGGTRETLTQTEEVLGWKPYIVAESRTGINRKDQEAYFRPGAKRMKAEISEPVILVGGMKSIDKIEEVLAAGDADFVALCRPLIVEPDLPNRWLAGEGSETARCISCNACLPLGPKPIHCRTLG